MDIQLKNALNEGRVKVTFRKADGTVRDMNATTNTSLFSYESKNSGRAAAPGQMVVWDLDKNDFRSFRQDSVIGWQPA